MASSDGLPELFCERLRLLVPKESYKTILKSFSVEKPTTLRANTLKIDAPTLTERLAARNILLEPVAWHPDAFIVKNVPLRTITETAEFTDGQLYVQSLSSMIPALVLDPKENEDVLDICAAPGSKTTQMAAMMRNTGHITAVDNSRIRLYRLEANLRVQNVTNATVIFSAAQGIWQVYPERFDKVLADVPCSMEGRFRTQDPKSYGFWTPNKVKELAEKQKWILRSAISATKPGGTIVYSTCTLSPEENEGVIDWILKKEQGNIELEQVTVPGLPMEQGLTGWKEKQFHPNMVRTARIWPDMLMEGFFVANIRKLKSTVPKAMSAR